MKAQSKTLEPQIWCFHNNEAQRREEEKDEVCVCVVDEDFTSESL